MKTVDDRSCFKSLIVALAVVVFFGCVTPTEPPPAWIDASDAHSERQFVAYGRGDDEDQARQRARDDAAAQIAQILLRNLETQGIVVTREVGETVEAQAKRRLETAEPADRFRRRDMQGGIEQYLLYEYLPEERNRDLTEIYEAATLGTPSQRSPELVERSPQDAEATSPLAAVRALLAESVPEAGTERSERLEEIRRRAEEVSVTVEPRIRTVALGESLSDGFTFSARSEDGGEPLHDVPLRVEIRGPLVDGQRTTSQTQVATDQDGTARIPVATPALAGTTRIDVEPLWLGELAERWEAQLESAEARDLLASIAERLRVRAAVQVTSQASSIPTAMVVLDRDIAGNPIESADTMRGMTQEFMDTDFRIREVELSSSARRRLAEAESISVADLYDLLPFDVLSRTERVIVGDAHILEFSEEDGFTVVVEVEAGAFDLRRDEVLARVSFQERISGSDARSAIRTAFQAAGRRLVRQIVPRLP